MPKIVWSGKGHISYTNKHISECVHKPTGICRQSVCFFRDGNPTNRGESFYFHPKDDQDHETFDEALQAAVNLGLCSPEDAQPYLQDDGGLESAT